MINSNKMKLRLESINVTFSILAMDQATGMIGGAAATGNLAVGGWVLRAASGTGAVATQGYSVSPLWGDRALSLLGDGVSAQEVVDRVTGEDSGREYRQLSVLDRTGGVAAWTGQSNNDAKDHILGAGFVVAGNWLTNCTLLEKMAETYISTDATVSPEFGCRLIDVLRAGTLAGGDARGIMSAAIRTVHPKCPPVDLRVDYDDDPLKRLRMIYDMVMSEPYLGWTKGVPTDEDPYRC